MSSKSKQHGCRICRGDLQGNQRRWLYASQKQRGGPPHTPTDWSTKGSLSGSALSSPWGSTLSLGFYPSPQTLPSPSKGADLLSILTHILGQPVPRGGGQREFLCGKCASLLERVFKFDTVISRVKLLSSERLQKLKLERDKIRQWVRNTYLQDQPSEFQSKENLSEVEDEKEGYRSMMRDNLALSEYECWSEKSNCCPYFQRTGKWCQKGKNCQGCNSLRVSDSDYESVCGIPRNLPFQPFSPLALSRDKSQSMPLNWSRVPSVSCSPTSLGGSCQSLRYQSQANSLQSLDSIDACDPFYQPETPSNLEGILKEVKCIPWKPLISPVGSRIPVLERASGCKKRELGHGMALARQLDFGEQNEEEMEVDSGNRDVLLEIQDEFLPLHKKIRTGQMHTVVKQLQEQLDQAQTHIKTLDGQLQNKTKESKKSRAVSNFPTVTCVDSTVENAPVQKLSHSLHDSVKLIQECIAWMRKLRVEMGNKFENADLLYIKMNTAMKNIENMIACLSKLREKEQDMEKELAILRQAEREREADLATLSVILQSNQDIMNDMHVDLGYERDVQQELHMEQAMRRLRDQILWAALQQKEALTLCQRETFRSSQKDVQDQSAQAKRTNEGEKGVEKTGYEM
ncbi:hypothetical protein AALO_G00185550 [Alosa alosa]|uniref:C3H1-type domain-containing protein n=1 Tax=Alosa alosa TaxID=278164 RepID=A0AAV6GEG9_9TELE|nr:uncharacterized protein si:ch73-95l15.5 [Alosa alosa]XP_048117605.1 uncharacterized protein si:ch73-95l15.5 [Alosa alosa]KAG5271917.1 hypothetical protein AALO_G00185550 [Alosa alosa]